MIIKTSMDCHLLRDDAALCGQGYEWPCGLYLTRKLDQITCPACKRIIQGRFERLIKEP